jgi:hypothetical protein
MLHVDRRRAAPPSNVGRSRLLALLRAAQHEAIQPSSTARCSHDAARILAPRRRKLHLLCQLLCERTATFACGGAALAARHALLHPCFRRDAARLFEPVGHRPTRPCTGGLAPAALRPTPGVPTARRAAFEANGGVILLGSGAVRIRARAHVSMREDRSLCAARARCGAGRDQQSPQNAARAGSDLCREVAVARTARCGPAYACSSSTSCPGRGRSVLGRASGCSCGDPGQLLQLERPNYGFPNYGFRLRAPPDGRCAGSAGSCDRWSSTLAPRCAAVNSATSGSTRRARSPPARGAMKQRDPRGAILRTAADRLLSPCLPAAGGRRPPPPSARAARAALVATLP